MVELNNRYKFNVKMEAIPDPATHPVMRTNISDIPSLYVNLIYTVGSSGITPTESEPLPEFSGIPRLSNIKIFIGTAGKMETWRYSTIAVRCTI